jgi:hypothetical protein
MTGDTGGVRRDDETELAHVVEVTVGMGGD